MKSYISSKHREIQILNTEKNSNNDKIFNLTDEEGNNISETIYYEEELDSQKEGNSKEYKFIILANKNIIENLKNNQITEYFFDCTYKCVPPTKPKMKLMVLCGYNAIIKKQFYVVLYYYKMKKNLHLKKFFLIYVIIILLILLKLCVIL